ncbi:cation channel sperm-associated protein 2 isoform X1 [Carassius auratus]|uniref:Cation channel sperm-associated protein 2 isoform X1 n=2 Tax=Carassius auratus TaxID=7957 RepID=A0A6P6JFU8_CARAU|nr:cation channel sperm-associated protein 2 isoform X1 [Carassius auratus]XP_052453311.1 cation channel sperm-associated protein 2 isoform X1 [Carassius gibelio]
MSSVIKGQENKTCESNQHEDNISTEESLSPRAQIIRSKLINMSDLCDLFPEREEHKDRPQHSVKDVTDLERYTSLENEYNHLVRFEISRHRKENITLEQRRLNRVLNRHSRYPPINMFAQWILESSVFKAIMLVLVILNVSLLSVEAEFHDYKDPSIEILLVVLQLLNLSILQVYVLEIILKWLDDFWLFWKCPWNLFDFAVTLMPVLPAIVPETFRGALISQKFLKLLVQFRVLRCLKIVSRFQDIRLMLQIIYHACGTVKLIFPVLLMSFLVFAVFGVVLFEKYTNSNIEGLLYKNDFKGLSSAFITLFSIFTLEHWLDLLKDIQRVPELNHQLCGLFIMVWLVFGALMTCVFMTVIIDDFQEIRNNLSKEVQQLKILRRAEMFKASHMGAISQTNQLKGHKPVKDEEEQPSPNVNLDGHTSRHELEWDMGLEAFIQAADFQDDCETECWREDNLHRFFEQMEKLQHNLEEMDQLQDILVQGFLNLHEC